MMMMTTAMMMMMNDNLAATNTDRISQKLEEILTASSCPVVTLPDFRRWFLQQFQASPNDCTLEEFAVYFLNAIRQKTYTHLRFNETNDASASGSSRQVSESQNQPIQPTVRDKNAESDFNKTSTSTMHTPVRSMNLSFPALSTTPGEQSFTRSHQQNSSTPVRRSLNQTPQRRSMEGGGSGGVESFSGTPNCNTSDRSRNSSFGGSGGGGGGGGSNVSSSRLCLGDFFTSPNVSNRHSHSHSNKKKTPTSSGSTTTTTTTWSTGNILIKVKKRVTPTTTKITNSNPPFGLNSSFSCDNNFLALAPTEVGDFNKRTVAEARKALKKDLTEVSSALKCSSSATTPISTPTKTIRKNFAEDATPTLEQQLDKKSMEMDLPLDALANLFKFIPNDNRLLLEKLASIYALLIDLNFCLNILNEISFLLNLLNVNTLRSPTASNSTPSSLGTKEVVKDNKEIVPTIELLKDITNSIYFAKCTLQLQEQTLVLMDLKSLGVILQSERLICLAPELKVQLGLVYERKQTLTSIEGATSVHDASFPGQKNVYFQEDSDSRKFFPSNNEFSAFKTQRDFFYIALKRWEKHHLNPSWNFSIEIAPKVREIFRQSENSITMTHFAKLFVAQLLISASDHTSPEEVGFGNDDVDLQKFNKLSQRLVAPSNFSVDYQFPREQAFFRDFIIESHSIAFMEHLKMILYLELITLNDSTFEQLNITQNDDDDDNEGLRDHHLHYQKKGQKAKEEEEEAANATNTSEFVVKPSVLGSMLILAKFLGFVTALPFQQPQSIGNNEAQTSSVVQNYQLKLRSLFQPAIDVCQLFEAAASNGRLLITLPWLVQYLAMLDDVTLRLERYARLMQKMFELYISLGYGEQLIRPLSIFIVRCCLGWLFEQKPWILNDYYGYRGIYKKNTFPSIKWDSKNERNSLRFETDALIESILSVACPFLAEFRVSIMPAKYASIKYVSRSGRYRHITPCIADIPSPLQPPQRTKDDQQQQGLLPNTTTTTTNTESKSEISSSAACTADSASQRNQRKLMESFLQSQNSSMHRLIDFLTERTYKCVIKDAQYKILLPSKSSADGLVNAITSCDQNEILEKIKTIYTKARTEALQQWNTMVPEMLNSRISCGLEALLPTETTGIIKQAYAWRIKSNAKIKIQQWLNFNLYKSNFYCNDMMDVAQKISEVNSNRPKSQASSATQSTELKLTKSEPSVSDLIEELQHWLYTTSRSSETKFRPEDYQRIVLSASYGPCPREKPLDEALIDFLERLTASFENTLPTIFYRLVGSGILQLLQHLISTRPQQLTPDVIDAICDFCSNERIRNADIATTPTRTMKAIGGGEEDGGDISNTQEASNAVNDTPTAASIYHALITAPFVESLGASDDCYHKLKEVLLAMIHRGLISMDFINDIFVGIFKEELQPMVLQRISKMLDDLVRETTSACGEALQDGKVDDHHDGSEDGRKSRLFMEFLADLSRDVDSF